MDKKEIRFFNFDRVVIISRFFFSQSKLKIEISSMINFGAKIQIENFTLIF